MQPLRVPPQRSPEFMVDTTSKETGAAAKTLTNSMFSGNTLFGIELPAAVAAPLRFAKGMIENELSHGIADKVSASRFQSIKDGFIEQAKQTFIEDNGVQPTEDQLTNLRASALKDAKAHASKVGANIGTAVTLAVKFLPTAMIGKDYFMAKRALSAKIDPISKILYPDRGFLTFGHSQNRVLQNASDQVHQLYNAKLMGSAVGFGIGAATQKYLDNEHKAVKDALDKQNQDKKVMLTLTGQDLENYRRERVQDEINGLHKPINGGGEMSKMLGGLAEGGSSLIQGHFVERLPKNIRDKTNSLDQCLDFIKRMQDRTASLDPLDTAKLDKEEKQMAGDVKNIIERIYVEADWNKMPETVSDEIDTITRAMVRPMLEGRLDATALIKLLGEDKVIRRNGTDIVDLDELKDTLEDLTKTLDPAKLLNSKSFFEQPGIAFSLEDVTKGWEHLSGSEKSLFAMLLSEKVLIAAGAKKGEIEEYMRLAEDLHPSFEEQGAMAIMALAELPEEDKRKMLGKTGAAYIDNAAKLIMQAMKDGTEKYDETISHVARLSRTKNILATVMTKAEPGKFTEIIEAKRAEMEAKAEEKSKKAEALEEHGASKDRDDLDEDAPYKASSAVSQILAKGAVERGDADSVTEHKGANKISKILAEGAAERGKVEDVIADRKNRDFHAEFGKH